MGDYHRTVGTRCLPWELVWHRETQETLPTSSSLLYISDVNRVCDCVARSEWQVCSGCCKLVISNDVLFMHHIGGGFHYHENNDTAKTKMMMMMMMMIHPTSKFGINLNKSLTRPIVVFQVPLSFNIIVAGKWCVVWFCLLDVTAYSSNSSTFPGVRPYKVPLFPK